MKLKKRDYHAFFYLKQDLTNLDLLFIRDQPKMKYCNQRDTNVHAHLLVVFNECYIIIMMCATLGTQVANTENNGSGRWLNANLNRQFVVVIWCISHLYLQPKKQTKAAIREVTHLVKR